MLPYEKASVCSLASAPTHVETITTTVCLVGGGGGVGGGSYGPFKSMAERVSRQPKAEQQLDCVDQSDGLCDTVRKQRDGAGNENAAAESTRHVQSVSGCNALNVRS